MLWIMDIYLYEYSSDRMAMWPSTCAFHILNNIYLNDLAETMQSQANT